MRVSVDSDIQDGNARVTFWLIVPRVRGRLKSPLILVVRDILSPPIPSTSVSLRIERRVLRRVSLSHFSLRGRAVPLQLVVGAFTIGGNLLCFCISRCHQWVSDLVGKGLFLGSSELRRVMKSSKWLELLHISYALIKISLARKMRC